MRAEGKLEPNYEIKPKASGGDWYRIKVGNRYYSTFDDPAPFRGKYVGFDYTESPNPKNVEHPYKNVVPGSMKEVEESDMKQPVVGQTETKEEQPYHNEGAEFGMVSNQTMDHLRYLREHKTSDKESPPFEDHWNEIFDTLWEINKKKHKEKLGY